MKQLIKFIFNLQFAISYILTIALLFLLYKLNINKSILFLILNLLLCASLFVIISKKHIREASAVLSGILTVVSGYYLMAFYPHFNDILEWDFLAFYVYGKAGADGLAIYDPASFTNILANTNMPYVVSHSFDIYVIKVGVCYPPTTMIMLAPLGLLNLEAANIAWRIFVLFFIAADVFLINNTFKAHESKALWLLIILVLILALPGSYTTVALSQTNFFLLFFILLIYRNMDNWKGGVFLALAMIVKPIAAIWGLYFIINKQWKPLTSAFITGLIIIALTVVIFGSANFMAFFTSSPALRLPATVYSETINQSMNAVLLRFSDQLGLDFIFKHMNLVVISMSVILVLLSGIASYRLGKTDQKAAFLIFLPLSLLIYPGCLTHYAVQLLPLFFALIMLNNKASLMWFAVFLVILSFSSFAASLAIFMVFLFYSFSSYATFSFQKASEKLAIKESMPF
jgi:hypothetical protein